ncbi:Benzoylformate decarboxylase [Pseudocercospora fuligena]|uniref:Benzoylformate decarboxylase n=1 Tax=Pseudocercospora fuligena TaxID=685502 RepID=A0A8H6RF25_9PEZI|nr:Benzoylformate decarboxylase [Pseudocercospora fuligena]
MSIVADLFLQALAEANVDYIFAVLGSDHPSIIEAYLRRQQEGKEWPKMLHFQHELTVKFVAISAADGYGRVSGKAQCVLVHVDVGTAALGQGLHNASTGRAPMLIFAGLAPYTLDGGLPGCRSEHVQWMQDVPNQAAIVAPYVRYSNEIKTPEHVRSLVNRALMMAQSGSQGPTYLTAAREVLAAPAAISTLATSCRQTSASIVGGLPPDAVETIGLALMTEDAPLLITGYLGRKTEAVRQLIDLANLALGMQVFDAENRYMSFPADHPAWLPRSIGGSAAIRDADFILVLDCDVPWIPSKIKPGTTRIFHIDIDPRKEKMQMFDIGAEATYLAECDLALSQLVEFVMTYKQSLSLDAQTVLRQRWALMESAHKCRLEMLETRSQPSWTGAISIDYLGASLRRVLPQDTIYVHDAVTNTTALLEQLQLQKPGTCLGKGGSGLGWAGGAAIGVKLAKDREGSTSLVCSISGDGAFVFGVPTAVCWAQKRLATPFLSIVLNNGGWKATRIGIKDVHPSGLASAASDDELGIDLTDDSPDYVGVAVAASNGSLWGARVAKAEELEDNLRQAVQIVQKEHRGALLEVIIS